jgi:glycosyltransferase involved in cell wall biosynthesis
VKLSIIDMKILQVSNFLAPVHGGSAEVPCQLSKALAVREHDVIIYTSRLNLNKNPNQITGPRIVAFSTWLNLASFDITPGLIKKAREEIRNVDVIHLHNYRTFQNIVVQHYAKKYGIPYIVQAHGSLTTYFQKGLLKKIFDLIWGRDLLRNAIKVFAVTAAEARQYGSLGVTIDKIEVVPHGVDLTEYDDRIEKGEFKNKYHLSDDQKIVLYLGRIHKMKGLDLLSEAYADLYGMRNDVKLVIAGPDDGYLSSLKKLVSELEIADGVIFAGPLYGRDKIQAYTDADVYVLPSSYEIFGITILEAWACRKPVIVTDRCGLADVVQGRAGLVVSYDKNKLRNALVEMLDSPQMRLEFGSQGRKLVEERYNWPEIALQVERIYDGIIANRMGKG